LPSFSNNPNYPADFGIDFDAGGCDVAPTGRPPAIDPDRGDTMRVIRAVIALVVVGLTGCVGYRPRDVIVSVRDAETHKPVPGAVVHVSMPHTADEGRDQTTLPNGMARVTFTPSSGEPILVEATAAGYVADSVVAGEQTVAAVATYPVVGPALPHAPDFTIELYPGPKFSVELVVPPGYRGLVRADLDFREGVPIPTGQRLYSFDVNAKGEAKGVGPAVLKRVSPSEYRARPPDATGPVDEGPDGIALRFLKNDAGTDVFVYGSREDFERYRKELGVEAPTNSAPPDTKKSGRGGGRRRGGTGGAGGS
jgi:hypothetical protein